MYKNPGTTFRRYFILFSICLFLFYEKSNGQGTGNPSAADTSKYRLVWSDEFDGTTINAATWNFETGGHGWGNHEQEYYQAANAGIENGHLVITAKKESVGSNKYTSARMTTLGKKEFKYGRIEARIKIPVGQGLWPAFWMMGANINEVDWPRCGEIDIMEHINADSLMYGTLHWDENGHKQSGDTLISIPTQFHLYSIQWDASSIKWFIDSTQFHEEVITGNSTNEFHQPFFILLNFAIGGDWPGQTVDDSLLPAKMYVDYVRVYQQQ